MVMMYAFDKQVEIVTDSFALLEALYVQNRIFFNNVLNKQVVELRRFQFLVGTICFEGAIQEVMFRPLETTRPNPRIWLHENDKGCFLSLSCDFEKIYSVALALQSVSPLYVYACLDTNVGVYKLTVRKIKSYLLNGFAEFRYL